MRKVGAVVVFAAVWLVVPSVAGASLHMPRQDRREIDALLDRFVPTALPRRHLAQAYDLVTPRLRGGLSRAAWAKSDVPVYPFPAARLRYHTWEPLLVTKNAVELSLFVQPRRGAKVGPIDFEIDLKRLGGRWLVDDVSIAAIFPAVGSGRKVWSGKDTAPALAQGREVGDDKGRISRAWIALPLGLVTLAILFPLAFFLHRWRQDRRAVRAYELSAGDARAAGP